MNRAIQIIVGRLQVLAGCLLLVFVATAAGCCKGDTCKKLVSDIGACVLDPMPQAVTNLVPTVTAILQGGAPDWSAQIKALERLGVGSVVCAVEAMLHDLNAKLPPARLHAEIDPRVLAAKQRAEIYLNGHGVKP